MSGFQGSTCLNTKENKNENGPYKWGHVANTYACLSALLMLGDDLSRINRDAIINSKLIVLIKQSFLCAHYCRYEIITVA